MTPFLFVFGTLRDPELLSLVSGAPDLYSRARPAHAAGWQVSSTNGGLHPAIKVQEGGVAEGLLLRDVPSAAMDRLNFFETAYEFSLHRAQVVVDQTTVEAVLYLPDHEVADAGGPWDFHRWQVEGRALFLEMASEVMSLYSYQTADNMPVNTAAIAVRSDTRLRAKSEIYHKDIRQNYTSSDVQVCQLKYPFSKFFALEEYTLTHPKFDGTRSAKIHREVFASADAVTVLPYDPVMDCVVLIEQFRMGAYARGDQKPWLLEAVAGRIEVGQTPEETARREAEEEAGLTLGRLEKISSYYTTPGAYNEYIYSFIGQADLSSFQPDVHGLATEHEDIATHLVSVDDLIAMQAAGQINNSPLVISTLWLAINRDRLQKDWTRA